MQLTWNSDIYFLKDAKSLTISVLALNLLNLVNRKRWKVWDNPSNITNFSTRIPRGIAPETQLFLIYLLCSFSNFLQILLCVDLYIEVQSEICRKPNNLNVDVHQQNDTSSFLIIFKNFTRKQPHNMFTIQHYQFNQILRPKTNCALGVSHLGSLLSFTGVKGFPYYSLLVTLRGTLYQLFN